MIGMPTIFCFRPQQGLTIMNSRNEIPMSFSTQEEFPSPTGVNYYEYMNSGYSGYSMSKFPSPTGVNYYE